MTLLRQAGGLALLCGVPARVAVPDQPRPAHRRTARRGAPAGCQRLTSSNRSAVAKVRHSAPGTYPPSAKCGTLYARAREAATIGRLARQPGEAWETVWKSFEVVGRGNVARHSHKCSSLTKKKNTEDRVRVRIGPGR